MSTKAHHQDNLTAVRQKNAKKVVINHKEKRVVKGLRRLDGFTNHKFDKFRLKCFKMFKP